jgi:hypothetical protein
MNACVIAAPSFARGVLRRCFGEGACVCAGAAKVLIGAFPKWALQSVLGVAA